MRNSICLLPALGIISLITCFVAVPHQARAAAPESGIEMETEDEPASTNATPAPNPAPVDQAIAAPVENAVVKVFSTVRRPHLYQPWTRRSAREYSGTGVVIEGNRILTNAHVVLYANRVQIQANQSGDKISARVEAIAPGIDLAVLKLDDEHFFDTHRPLPRATSTPEIKDSVMVYGFPKGGEGLSLTKGIVSRIDFVPYHYPTEGLRIQIDAAINPGNSGGPAMVGDKMVGVAFSHLQNAQNIGYVIPCEEIDLFLKDIADGHYDGKPTLEDEFQTLENSSLRTYLKLDNTIKGIIVSKTHSSNPAYPLKPWDIITQIGNLNLDDQGMVNLSPTVRVRFPYLIQKFVNNGKLPVTVVRAGRPLHLDLPVAPESPMLIPPLAGAYPSYFIYGPLVFSNASQEFLAGYARQTGGGFRLTSFGFQGSPLINQIGEKAHFPGENLVVVAAPFFPHRLSQGYGNHMGMVVKTVNGTPVKNLEHLVQLLRDSKDQFITFGFYERYQEALVFPRAEMVTATEELLTENGVRTQASPDLLAVWSAKPVHN